MAGLSVPTGLDNLFLLMAKRRALVVPNKGDWSSVITVSVNDTVKSAFDTLCDNDILSAPVLGAHRKYVGWIDMSKLLTFLVDMNKTSDRPGPAFAVRQKLGNAALRELPGVFASPPEPINKNLSLFYAFEQLARQHERRAVICDESDNLWGVITEMSIIEWLNANLDTINASVRSRSVWMLRPYRSVMSIPSSESAIKAFRLMSEKSVTAVAVMDPVTGKLEDSISIKDLKGLKPGPTSIEWKDMGPPADRFGSLSEHQGFQKVSAGELLL